jgi:hypothetical protein
MLESVAYIARAELSHEVEYGAAGSCPILKPQVFDRIDLEGRVL